MTAPAYQEPRGYHRLADLMGQYPEVAIFRRFGSLNALNLLSLQAELINLQVEFRDVWIEDDISTDESEKRFSSYFLQLHNAEESFQLKKLLEIRKKLQEYNAALLQASQIERLSSPDPANLQFLREWLGRAGEGDNFLKSSEVFTWDLLPSSSIRERKLFDKDLLTLHLPLQEQDMFSKLLSSSLLDFWTWIRSCTSANRRKFHYRKSQGHSCQKSIDPSSGILHYSDSSLLKINNIFISVVGATMPIVAIVALYFIKTEGGRLGATAGFTVLFAFVLAVCTNARRLEIAATTAA
ncbi:unnamed protein product [Alternaria alternata]